MREALETQVQSLGQANPRGEGNGNPLQYSCLETPMDRGAWRATYNPWGSQASDTAEQMEHSSVSGTWGRAAGSSVLKTFCPRALPRGVILPGLNHLCWPELTAVFWAGCLWQASWCFSHAHALRKLFSGTHRMLKLGMVSRIPLYDLQVFFFKVKECSKVFYLWSLLNFQWVSIIVTFSLCCGAQDWESCRQTDWRRAFLAVGSGPGRNPESYLITCIWFLPLSPIGVPVANERILKGVQGCN